MESSGYEHKFSLDSHQAVRGESLSCKVICSVPLWVVYTQSLSTNQLAHQAGIYLGFLYRMRHLQLGVFLLGLLP